MTNKELDIESLKQMILWPDLERIKDYGTVKIYVKMLVEKLRRLEECPD